MNFVSTLDESLRCITEDLHQACIVTTYPNETYETEEAIVDCVGGVDFDTPVDDIIWMICEKLAERYKYPTGDMTRHSGWQRPSLQFSIEVIARGRRVCVIRCVNVWQAFMSYFIISDEVKIIASIILNSGSGFGGNMISVFEGLLRRTYGAEAEIVVF